jgi:hypothetical protein
MDCTSLHTGVPVRSPTVLRCGDAVSRFSSIVIAITLTMVLGCTSFRQSESDSLEHLDVEALLNVQECKIAELNEGFRNWDVVIPKYALPEEKRSVELKKAATCSREEYEKLKTSSGAMRELEALRKRIVANIRALDELTAELRLGAKVSTP